MPVFEYVCRRCQSRFEELVRTDADAEHVACPDCGKGGAERVMSVFAARTASAAPRQTGGGGCGRCGDPRGSCGSD